MFVFMDILRGLLSQLGMIVLAAFILSKSRFLKEFVLKANLRIHDRVLLAVVFGLVGIIGTYTGVPILGAIANSRAIGVTVAGLLGGPFVGIGAGLIAGLHRMFFAAGEFTAIPCGISTLVGGLMAGYAKAYIDNKEHRWLYGAGIAALIETTQMGIILLMARPFSEALALVELIFIPMTVINAFGTGAFMLLVQQIYEEKEKAGAVKAALALDIATKTLPYLRKGLTVTSAEKTVRIIYEATEMMAVSMTDKEQILSHVGAGDDHHQVGRSIYTEITKKAIANSKVMISETTKDVECRHEGCPLKAAIVVPLIIEEQVTGTLKLYRKHIKHITTSDIELAKGLGQLFSIQLELSAIDRQKSLRAKAEMQALQAQIQPHFLFNALNTIVSFCRTKPLVARDLLLQLSFYLRTNFKQMNQFVPLAKEIEYVNAYLTIEKARFGNRLEVSYDIAKEDQHVQIPSLTLQPIVENAVRHGILPQKDGGKVRILTKKSQEFIHVCVIDNGVGISDQEMMNIWLKKEPRDGIGLWNVDQRLKALYGKGLEISSKKGEWTEVCFRIPIEGGITHESHIN